MLTTLEDAEKHTVRMTVEVPPDEFAKDLARAYRKVAGQVRIPGFRKGKAPRRVIDAMVGRDVVFEEFVHDTVPAYYAKAVDEHELVPIAEPEIDIDAVDGAMVSTSVFEDRTGAEESTKRAADFVRENLASLLPNPPQVTAGEVVASAALSGAAS